MVLSGDLSVNIELDEEQVKNLFRSFMEKWWNIRYLVEIKLGILNPYFKGVRIPAGYLEYMRGRKMR